MGMRIVCYEVWCVVCVLVAVRVWTASLETDG